MFNGRIHRVKKIRVVDVHQLTDKTFTADLIIESEDGNVTIDLFSNDKKSFEVVAENE